jgi:hypothetical protein
MNMGYIMKKVDMYDGYFHFQLNISIIQYMVQWSFLHIVTAASRAIIPTQVMAKVFMRTPPKNIASKLGLNIAGSIYHVVSHLMKCDLVDSFPCYG